jgi:hypothetical protein
MRIFLHNIIRDTNEALIRAHIQRSKSHKINSEYCKLIGLLEEEYVKLCSKWNYDINYFTDKLTLKALEYI